MNQYFNNSHLLSAIYRWRKHLFFITITSALLALLFSSSWFITPKYNSFAILYPANIIPFGTETPTEQMLQILQSEDIRNGLISDFNLYQHYKIDSAENKFHQSEMYNELKDNLSISKTEYESVKIEMSDRDPVLAAEMVDRVIDLFNQKERLLQKEKAVELVNILKKELDKKRSEMDSMEAVIRDIRMNYGILDYVQQVRYATDRYLKVMTGGGDGKSKAKEIEPLLKNLENKGGEFVALNEHVWRVRGTYNDLKIQYETALRDVEKDMTYTNVVTYPFAADKKSYPVRWLIVLLSAFSTLLISLLAISAIENLSQLQEVNLTGKKE